MKEHIKQTQLFHEKDYEKQGLKAQRNYPNEELCRFMGRHFFSKPRDERSKINILETGCGSGANLWMIAYEGFNTTGLDISEQGLKLCEERLKSMGLEAQYLCASMTDIPSDDQEFDAIIDVFSSHCLDLQDKEQYMNEISRLLKKDGLFFSYHPSKNSKAFIDHAPAELTDASTLNGILREGSAFYRYENSFAFLSPEEYSALAQNAGLETIYLETVGRTYRNQDEYFEFVTVVFQKL